MNSSLALGCAVYFDAELSSSPAPVAALFSAVTEPFASDRLISWTTSEKSQQVQPAAPFDLGSLLRKVEGGLIASAAVESSAATPDAEKLLVLAQTTPLAKLREGTPPRHWKYNLVAAFGGVTLQRLHPQQALDALVAFGDAVAAKAGVIHWTETASYAAALAMGASGGLTPIQESRVAASLFWRSHWGRIIRGPSWGTFLAADHVKRLGGIARVQAESGCARVVPLVSGGAFLQLTSLDVPLLESQDDKRMDNLISFLQPVIGKVGH